MPAPIQTPTDMESGCLFITQNAPTANPKLANPVINNWNPTLEKCLRKTDVKQQHKVITSWANKLKFINLLGFKRPLSDDSVNICFNIVRISEPKDMMFSFLLVADKVILLSPFNFVSAYNGIQRGAFYFS